MPRSKVVLETTAEHYVGFPLILWKAVHDVLGSPARPMYVVSRGTLPPAGGGYRADVHITPCPLGTNQAYLF